MKVECLMFLFTPAVMCCQLLLRMQVWNRRVPIMRNGDTQAKDLDRYQEEDQYVILVA